MTEEPDDPRDDTTIIEISIEWDMSGNPYDWGLRYPNDNVPLTDAKALLEYIKENCNGSKSEFIRDWDLLDDPRIMVSMRRPDEQGISQATFAEWGQEGDD